MAQRPVFIEGGQKSVGQKSDPLADLDSHPAPEEQLGGGDICSLEEEPSTDDDKPLE
jgi:hypothetical protein